MGDYGRPLTFGHFLSPELDADPLGTADAADRYGLDLIGIQDHPYQRRFLDTLTLMQAVLSATSRVHVFPAVASLPLRPPAVLAKAIASMDVLSGGRAELGLGAGAFWDAIEGYGGPRRTAAEARAALEEAIGVVRGLWSDRSELHLDGDHYRLDGAQPGPEPVHPIQLWLGVTGPRSLALTGGVADGWVASSPYVPPDRLVYANARLDAAAEHADRSPDELRRIYILDGRIEERSGGDFLRGPVEQWVDQLTDLALTHGIDTFLYAGPADHLSSFALEIAPAVRERAAHARA
ncbi:LLM class flavin-dependent oxidoreductase [Actinomadura flavalba]|uniref:LLM class flavin-dependent oxidoreductase n=1 Tax=Actinomadura flavalba TaxID=1120938 RepID=UPI0003759E58|nr:LLM class flavin-dependent oxidoreductase [Actinomadura flavalba]